MIGKVAGLVAALGVAAVLTACGGGKQTLVPGGQTLVPASQASPATNGSIKPMLADLNFFTDGNGDCYRTLLSGGSVYAGPNPDGGCGPTTSYLMFYDPGTGGGSGGGGGATQTGPCATSPAQLTYSSYYPNFSVFANTGTTTHNGVDGYPVGPTLAITNPNPGSGMSDPGLNMNYTSEADFFDTSNNPISYDYESGYTTTPEGSHSRVTVDLVYHGWYWATMDMGSVDPIVPSGYTGTVNPGWSADGWTKCRSL